MLTNVNSIYLPDGKFDIASFYSASICYKPCVLAPQGAYRVLAHIEFRKEHIENPAGIYIDMICVALPHKS